MGKVRTTKTQPPKTKKKVTEPKTLPTIKIAFFRANRGEIDDKAIDFVTGRGGFSHCEVMINKTTMIGSHYELGGVVLSKFNKIIGSDEWIVLDTKIAWNPDAKTKLIEQINKVGYDTKGVVCKALIKTSLCIDDKKTWCSKLCAETINNGFKTFDVFKDINIMPNELYRRLKKMGATVMREPLSSNKIVRRRKVVAHAKYIKPIDRFGRIKVIPTESINKNTIRFM